MGPKIDKTHLGDKYLQNGKIATIVCGLEEGDPPMSFTWTKDGNPATSLADINVVNQRFSSLLTISATSGIHAGSYICKASNPVSWAVMTFRIFVDGIV